MNNRRAWLAYGGLVGLALTTAVVWDGVIVSLLFAAVGAFFQSSVRTLGPEGRLTLLGRINVCCIAAGLAAGMVAYVAQSRANDRTQSALLRQIERALHPLGDLRISLRYLIPPESPGVAAYLARVGGELRRTPLSAASAEALLATPLAPTLDAGESALRRMLDSRGEIRMRIFRPGRDLDGFQRQHDRGLIGPESQGDVEFLL